MSEPAKNEAELLDRILQAIWDGCDENLAEANPAIDAIVAIRAAGWAVVPMEPTEEVKDEIINAMIDSGYITANEQEAAKIYRAAIRTAAPGVKP
jgi:hypothetical protein